MIKTPEGPIVLRAPTEAEAIAFEDKRRYHRRPQQPGEEMAGGVYDSGLKELLACTIEPVASVLDPDDGWLARWPGLIEEMAAQFRRLGGDLIPVVEAPELIKDPGHVAMGWRAIGLRVGAAEVVCRRITFPEYNAFQAALAGDNLYSLVAKIGKDHLLSHRGEGEADRLWAQHPYLSQRIGLKLLDLAHGRAEAAQKKSVSG